MLWRSECTVDVQCQLYKNTDKAFMLQVGFGSGFKCNSAVWKAVRNIHDTEHNEWAHMEGSNLDRCWKYVQVCNRALHLSRLHHICLTDRNNALVCMACKLRPARCRLSLEVSSQGVPHEGCLPGKPVCREETFLFCASFRTR